MRLGLKRIFLVFLGVVLGTIQPCEASHVLYLGGGAISHNSGIASNNAYSGVKPYLGSVYSQASLAVFLKLSHHWLLSPDFHYTFPGMAMADQQGSTRLYCTGVRAIYQLSDAVDLHLGPGALFYQISGDGGVTLQNNGSSQSYFGVPGSLVTAYVLYWDAGFGVSVGRFRLDGSVLVSGVFSSLQRVVHPMLTLSVGLF